MAGYFGTDLQVRLQSAVDRSVDWISATPGACNSGRCLGCDDVEQLGWDRIDEILARDGIINFRLVPVERLGELSTRLSGRGYRFDQWDVFVGRSDDVLSACESIVAEGLAQGLAEIDSERDPQSSTIAGLQRLMVENGIAPFSGSVLTGQLGPATLVAALDGDRRPVATAFAHRPHNRFSRWRDHAWGGLVAVDPAWRGRGLGRYVNARMATRACKELGAGWVYEQVSATNLASRRMVESCGLKFDPTLKSGLAIKGEMRYTR